MGRRRSHPQSETLRAFPLFEGVSDARLVELAEQAQPLSVRAGELLMLERFRGEQFLIVLEGVATVRHGEQELATVGPGSFLGEIGLLQDTDRSATVVARTPMKLLALDEPAFRALLDDLPEVGRRIREEAALRLAVDDPSDN